MKQEQDIIRKEYLVNKKELWEIKDIIMKKKKYLEWVECKSKDFLRE